jgi:phosphoribosylaminoimidazole-succinocarboxamide synthase
MLAESLLRSGKVRDLHMLNDGRLLLVASDRISAFDVVLPTEIPDKGRVLTALSRFWFAETAGIVPNHLLDTDLEALTSTFARDIRAVGHVPPDFGPLDELRGRLMICRPARVVPIEAVVRGYLAGSGWKEYQASGTVCGIPLPAGLRESDRLPEPIFTPATKATSGHDINISEAEAGRIIGETLVRRLRELTIALYQFGAAHAEARGIILADTKFEFGLGSQSEIILIDEVLTPDSSRYWPQNQYAPGGPQPSFDKQYVRDYLEQIHWNKQPPVPALPEEVVMRTREKYIEAYRRLTGKELA